MNIKKINKTKIENLNLKAKDIIFDAYAYYNLDNTFCIFESIDNILYLIYSTEKHSIISYNLIDFKKIIEIKNAHFTFITNFNHCQDLINKRDLLLSISSEINEIKLWNINNWTCLLDLTEVNERGLLFSANFLKDDKSKIYIISSNAFQSPEPIKIYDLKGNKINEISDSKDITYSIDAYYEFDENGELLDIYIITANLGYIKSFNYLKNKLYYKYGDNDFKGHGSFIIYIDNFKIVKLIESNFNGFLKIWKFHSGILLNNIKIDNSCLYGICLLNEEYLLIGCRDKSIKIFEMKNLKVIKELRGHDNRVLTIRKIFHPLYKECIFSQGFEFEEIKLWTFQN